MPEDSNLPNVYFLPHTIPFYAANWAKALIFFKVHVFLFNVN